MSLEGPIETVTEADLAALIPAEVRESKLIEYKRDLPGTADSDKKEFLFDVSSFANASGGNIVYGMAASEGLPTEITGFDGKEIDGHMLRLDQLVQSGISPRIPGLRFKAVELGGSKSAILARIPKTWTGPHMVTFQRVNKFYSRNSGGKYLLDIDELRSAFLLGEGLGERMRAFRLDRVNTILIRELSVNLHDSPKIVLHILPTAAFRPGFQIDLKTVEKTGSEDIRPMGSELTGTQHYNYHGLLSYQKIDDKAHSYVQVFRNGCIEAVETSLLRPWDGKACFPSIEFEREIIHCGNRLFNLLKKLKVDPPFIAMLSFLGVRGYWMNTHTIRYTGFGVHQIERNDLYLDDVVIENDEMDFTTAIKPAFDQVWNACGWSKSLNYGEDGKWRAHPR
jgi:hypothetical protein